MEAQVIGRRPTRGAPPPALEPRLVETITEADGDEEDEPGATPIPRNETPASELSCIPGWRREWRCSWCNQLGDRLPELLDLVHRRHFAERLGSRALAKAVAPRLRAVGLKPLSARSLSRHLLEHVDPAAFAEAPSAPRAQATGSAREVREFRELWSLYERQSRRIKNIDDGLVVTDPQLEAYRAAQLAALTSGARATLEAINRVRGSETVQMATAKHAIKIALGRAAEVIAEHLNAEIQRVELTPEGAAVAEALRRLVAPNGQLMQELLGSMVEALHDVLEWAQIDEARPEREGEE